MKKRFKKLAAVVATTAVAISIAVPALAVSYDEWGTGWYTPYQAIVSFNKTNVQGTNMKWDVTQVPKFHNSSCWELEFRPYLGTTTIVAPSKVETTNAEIAEAAQMDTVSFADTFNYPEAEQVAQEKNVPVSYIAVPEKPDDAK